MKQRLLALLLTLCMVFSLLPAAVLADAEPGEERQNDDIALDVQAEAGPTEPSEEEAEPAGDTAPAEDAAPAEDSAAAETAAREDAPAEARGLPEEALPDAELDAELIQRPMLMSRGAQMEAAAAAGDVTGPAIVLTYRLEDVDGTDLSYDAASGCYVRKFAGASSDAIPDGTAITADGTPSLSDLLRTGRYRLVAYCPPGYYFCGWETSDSAVFTVSAPSGSAETEPTVKHSGRMISAKPADMGENVCYVTPVFRKLADVSVTFAYDTDSFSGVSYTVLERAHGTTDVYDVSESAVSVSNGQTLSFHVGDTVRLDASYTASETFHFDGFRVDGSIISYDTTGQYYYFIAGEGLTVDGVTVTAAAVDSSYQDITGYTNPDYLTVTTKGDYPWTLQDDGSIASGNAGHTWSISMLKVKIAENADSGMLTFDYRTSTNAENNFLLYRKGAELTSNRADADNDDIRAQFSGVTPWTRHSIAVEAGDTVYIGYWKNAADSELGEDAVWLRNLRLASGGYTIAVSSSDATYGTAVADMNYAQAGETVTLTATTLSGGQFYGWLNTADNTILSLDASYSFTALENMTIVGVFGAAGSFVARIGGTYYTALDAAVAAAQNGDTVVLTGDATVSADLTIPTGVTLLIPYAADKTSVNGADSDRPWANTASAASASPQITAPGTNVSYTLTVADYASITVANGAKLIVGGVFGGGHPVGGQVCGAHGEIVLGDYAGINVNGILSASGYITGETGYLTVGAAGKVYENFVVLDYHGGTYTMNAFTKGQSPFDAFTMMNLRAGYGVAFAPGAELYGYCALSAAGTFFSTTAQVLGGSEALIQLTSGTVTMDYVSSRSISTAYGDIGTLRITVDGDAAIGSLIMDLAGFITVNTASFECPLSYNFQIQQYSGTLTLNSKIKLMPGAELKSNETGGGTIRLATGASLTVYPGYEGQNSFSTYPTAAQLEAAGIPTEARLEIGPASTLIVEDDAAIAGTVYTTGAGAKVQLGAATLTGATYTHDSAQNASYTGTTLSLTLHSSQDVTETPEPNVTCVEQADGSYSDVEQFTVVWDVDGMLTEEKYMTGETPEFPGGAEALRPDESGVGNEGGYSREGWQFSRWEPAIAPVTADAVYTARFANPVSYDDGVEGETVEVPAGEYAEWGSTYTVSAAVPVRAGYTFAGWQSAEVEVVNGQFTMPDRSVTLIAQWTEGESSYTITWVVDGVETTEEYASGAMPVYNSGATPAAGAHPQGKDRTGTAFVGWYPALAQVSRDETYTAVFSGKVSFVDGVDDAVIEVPDDITAEWDAKVTVTAEPDEREGYTFNGWTSDDVTVVNGSFVMPDYNVTLRAKWKEDNGGGGTSETWDWEKLVAAGKVTFGNVVDTTNSNAAAVLNSGKDYKWQHLTNQELKTASPANDGTTVETAEYWRSPSIYSGAGTSYTNTKTATLNISITPPVAGKFSFDWIISCNAQGWLDFQISEGSNSEYYKWYKKTKTATYEYIINTTKKISQLTNTIRDVNNKSFGSNKVEILAWTPLVGTWDGTTTRGWVELEAEKTYTITIKYYQYGTTSAGDNGIFIKNFIFQQEGETSSNPEPEITLLFDNGTEAQVEVTGSGGSTTAVLNNGVATVPYESNVKVYAPTDAGFLLPAYYANTVGRGSDLLTRTGATNNNTGDFYQISSISTDLTIYIKDAFFPIREDFPRYQVPTGIQIRTIRSDVYGAWTVDPATGLLRTPVSVQRHSQINGNTGSGVQSATLAIVAETDGILSAEYKTAPSNGASWFYYGVSQHGKENESFEKVPSYWTSDSTYFRAVFQHNYADGEADDWTPLVTDARGGAAGIPVKAGEVVYLRYYTADASSPSVAGDQEQNTVFLRNIRFTPVEQPVNLTVLADDAAYGSYSIVKGITNGQAALGDLVSLTAEANASTNGFFEGWYERFADGSEALVSTDESYSFYAGWDRTIVARFHERENQSVTLTFPAGISATVACGGETTAAVSGQPITVEQGRDVRIVATSDGSGFRRVGIFDERGALLPGGSYGAATGAYSYTSDGERSFVIDDVYQPIGGYTYDTENMTVKTEMTYPWRLQSDGSLISGNQNVMSTVSVVSVTAKTPGRFYAEFKKAASYTDKLYYSVGAEPTASGASGETLLAEYSTDWDEVYINLAAGETVFLYFKNSSGTPLGTDAGFLRNLCFYPGDPEFTVSSSNESYGTVSVSSYGVDPAPEEGTLSWTATFGEAVTVVATPTEGCQFVGWVNERSGVRTIVSTESTYSFPANGSMDLVAVFAPALTGDPVAAINDALFGTLEAAFAVASAGDTVVLLKDYDLTDEHMAEVVIPAGVTLLLPIPVVTPDSSNNLKYSSAAFKYPGDTIREAWSNPTRYLQRTLTVPAGVTLTVNGTLYVAGTQHKTGQNAQGHTSGDYTQIVNNGTINVPSGGTLFVRGLISGSGTVDLAEGAEGHIPFITLDFAGGSNTDALYSDGDFPFHVFSTNNVQCRFVIHGGSDLYGVTSLYALGEIFLQEVDLIRQDSGLIYLPVGSTVTATYDPTKTVNHVSSGQNFNDYGKTTLTVDGDAGAGRFYILGYSSTEAGMFLNLPYTYDLVVNSGEFTLNYSYRVMPGATLTVNEGATLTLPATYARTEVDKQGNTVTTTYYPRLQISEGWHVLRKSGKYYPTAAALEAKGMDSVGHFVLNGTLNLNGGFSGTIETEGTSAAVVVGNHDRTRLGGSFQAGSTGSYTDDLVSYELPARLRIGSELMDMQRNTTYYAVGGEAWTFNQATQFINSSGSPGPSTRRPSSSIPPARP